MNIFVNKYLNIFEYPNIRYTFARISQDDVVDVFEEFMTPAWLQKTDSILVGRPKPTESFRAITPSQEQCLDKELI